MQERIENNNHAIKSDKIKANALLATGIAGLGVGAIALGKGIREVRSMPQPLAPGEIVTYRFTDVNDAHEALKSFGRELKSMGFEIDFGDAKHVFPGSCIVSDTENAEKKEVASVNFTIGSEGKPDNKELDFFITLNAGTSKHKGYFKKVLANAAEEFQGDKVITPKPGR